MKEAKTMSKRALITGITGQDGAYLAKLLLEKGYEVWGAYRRSASLNLWRLEELGLRDDVRLIPLDLLEYSNIMRALEKVQPDEIYNLDAQSFVALSFEMPLYTADADALGVTRLVGDSALREELKRKGLERAKQFTWERTADLTWQVLQGVMEEG